MKSLRWACLAAFLLATTAIGCGSSDASKVSPNDPVMQSRTAQIERFKARTSKPGASPARAARRPAAQ